MTGGATDHETLRAALAILHDGVLAIDARGLVVAANPAAARIFGYAADELIGEPLARLLVASRDPAELVDVGPRERTGLRKDGAAFPIELALTRGERDGQAFFAGVVRDISERKRVEEALRASEEALLRARQSADAASAAKSRFVADMSHEIRTPLNAVLGLTELLLGTPVSAHQRDYIAKIQGAGEHLLALVGGVLDLSKIESGNLTLERIAFEPRALIAGAAELLSDAARRKGLRFEQAVAPEVPRTCVGDPTRIRQVLANLLGNAVRFTDEGEIRVEVEYADGTLRCSVRDTGTGIPKDKLAEAFEPFQQVDPSIARRYGGTGLGLAICTNLVRFMGGTMTAESELGRGSRFSFEIPLAAADEPPAPRPTEAPPVVEAPSPEAEPPRVLIAEDHALNRMVVEAFLKELGFRVESVEDGRAAVEAYTAGAFDLVLMDVQMPELDGLGATREIRALERSDGRRPAVILALTAGAFADDVAACMEAGCDGHLAKPLHRPTLREKIRQALASRG